MHEKLFGKNNCYCCLEIPKDFLMNKLKLKSVFRHPIRKLTSVMSVVLIMQNTKERPKKPYYYNRNHRADLKNNTL